MDLFLLVELSSMDYSCWTCYMLSYYEFPFFAWLYASFVYGPTKILRGFGHHSKSSQSDINLKHLPIYN